MIGMNQPAARTPHSLRRRPSVEAERSTSHSSPPLTRRAGALTATDLVDEPAEKKGHSTNGIRGTDECSTFNIVPF